MSAFFIRESTTTATAANDTPTAQFTLFLLFIGATEFCVKRAGCLLSFLLLKACLLTHLN